MEISFSCFGVSIKGRDKSYNQDYFAFTKSKKGCFLAVCDGLGSKSKSHLGSKTLARSAANLAKKMELNLENLEFYEQRLMKIWIKKLNNPQNLKDFSTTLLCVFIYNETTYIGRVGDGVVTILGKENICLEQQDDFANVTTPFGASKIKWDIIKSTDIESVSLCSDGICEFLDESKRLNFFKEYIDEYKNNKSKNRVAEIMKWLNDFNKLGFKDDKTLLVAYKEKNEKK